MEDTSTPAVIAGLGVGIALIVLFGSIYTLEKPLLLYRIIVGDTTFVVPYRFSEGEDARIVNFTVAPDVSSMSITVDIPRDTTLEIHLPIEMLKQLEGVGDYAYRVGDELVIFVDEVPKDTELVRTDNEEIITIRLEAGTQTIEIVGSFLI